MHIDVYMYLRAYHLQTRPTCAAHCERKKGGGKGGGGIYKRRVEKKTGKRGDGFLMRARINPGLRDVLDVAGIAALLADLAGAALDLGGDVGGVEGLVGARDDPGRVGEEVVHLLERQLLGLRQQQVEEDRVREVAHHEQQEVPPPRRVDRDLRHLPDHRVERVARHRRDRDALRPRVRVEDLCRDDPARLLLALCVPRSFCLIGEVETSL